MADEGSSGFSTMGKALHSANEFIFVKNKKITSIISIIVIVGLTFLVFNAEAAAKAEEMLGRSEILEIIRAGGGGSVRFEEVEDFVPVGTQQRLSGELVEGTSAPGVVVPNTEESVLSSLELRLTWTDESEPPGLPKIRNYENEPDTFSVKVSSPNGTLLFSDSSDSGSISGSFELSDQEMEGSFGEGNFTVEVTLVEAGDWVPRFGPGLITYSDDENSYEIVLNFVHLEPEESP